MATFTATRPSERRALESSKGNKMQANRSVHGRGLFSAWRRLAAASTLLALLSACGGGGDSGSNPGTVPGDGTAPPVAGSPAGATFVLMPTSTQIAIDGQATFFALQPPGALTWSSSDSTVASVDANGQVTARARGNAVITATSGTTMASSAVKVYQASGPGADAKSEALIAQALGAGSIDTEQALIYRVYAQFGDTRLPAAYAGAPGAAPDHMLLREVAAKLPTLSQGAQDVLRPFFLPPIYAQSWYAQQLGTLAPQAAPSRSTAQSARVRPADIIANCDFAAHPLFIGRVSTDHFNVFYIGPPFFDKNKELADLVAAVAEEVYTAETGLLGREPQPDTGVACNGGDAKVDIYLTLGKDPHTLAQTVPYKATCDNTPSFILLNEFSSIFFAAYLSPNGQARDAVKSVVGHEFLHVLQFAMSRDASCDDRRWFDEATAEWAMDYVVPTFGSNQLAAPGLEDGYPAVASKRRSGGFLAEYLYTGHLRSIEKGVPDNFGYADYLFFQFLARKYQPSTIKQIYDTMANGFSSVDAISLSVDMKTAWPEFAKSLWNDVENKVLDYWQTEDGYDFGLYDVFHNASSLKGAPSNLKPLDVDQLSKPDAVFTLLDNALLASKSGDYEIAPRSMIYEELRFTDATVHSVVFANPIAGTPNNDFMTLWVVKKIGGKWKTPEDWTKDDFKAFCLDQKDERIEELLVIVSNSEVAPKTEQPFRISLRAPMQVSTSNVGCWRFEGTASTTTTSATGPVTVESATVTFDRFQNQPPLNLPDSGLSSGYNLLTASKGGSVSFSISGFDTQSGCSLTGNANAAMTGDNDGSLILNFGLPVPLYRIVIGQGARIMPGVRLTSNCNGNVETFNVDENVHWLSSFPDPGAGISADGQTISGKWDRVDSDGAKTTVWDFHSVRQK